MLHVLNSDKGRDDNGIQFLDRGSKIEKALNLLNECGLRAIIVDLDSARNAPLTAAIIRSDRTVEPKGEASQLDLKLPNLSAQQKEVLKSIGDAKPNKVIAYEMGIAETTVKSHVTNIYRKLGVRNRSEAILFLQAFRTQLASLGMKPERAHDD